VPDEPLDGKLAVPVLAALVLRDRAQHRPRAADHPLLLDLGETGGRRHIEDRLDSRLRPLGMLAARTARPGEAQLDLGPRDGDRTRDPNRLALHVPAILLDVDGCLHLNGTPYPGAVEAVARLREAGHRLRFVTNNTIRSAATLAGELRKEGFDLADDELQTAPRAAAHALAGRRVLALTMPAIVEDLEGIVLTGEEVDAVLFGGADDLPETNRVFSYMNLARAFAELQAGAELYCLHKNRWWQTERGPLLDSGSFVAGLEYAARVEAHVLGKPSGAYFQAALEAVDGEPARTYMVGDDVEADVGGAQALGMHGVLVRTGKFRDAWLESSGVKPDAVLDSVANLPEWLEENTE